LREENRLRVFESMELSRITGSKMYEVTVEWRKLHSEELNDLYPSLNTIRVIKSRIMRWVGQAAFMVEINAYTVLVGKREGKRLLARARRRWEDNVKMDLQEVGCETWN